MPTAHQLIEDFLSKRTIDARYASWDFCYNYFSGFAACSGQISSRANQQTSCLHLLAYLASWGMLRGSSRLLQERNVRHFLPLIELLGTGQLDALWKIDCDRYTDDNIQQLVNAYRLIALRVVDLDQQGLILVTKIMMGIFGCCPAFDSRATDSLRQLYSDRCGFRRFNENALSFVQHAYLRSKRAIDFHAAKIVTLDFDGGCATQRLYPKAKLLDMILFQADGQSFEP